jgi:hypothetical protein
MTGPFAPLITSCLITDNIAGESGGGIWAGPRSAPDIRHVTIAANIAAGVGGAVHVASGATVSIESSILWLNLPATVSGSPTISYSDVQGGFDGPGNINADPLFKEYNSLEYMLAPGSPAIDTGLPGEKDSVEWPDYYPNTDASDMGVYGGPDGAGWMADCEW